MKVALRLCIHPAAQRLEDLPVVVCDHREVLLAHLRSEGLRVLLDLRHVLGRVGIERTFRCLLQVRDRKPPRCHGFGHVGALLALTGVAHLQRMELRCRQSNVGFRQRRRCAHLRGRRPALGLLSASIRLPEEAFHPALLLSERPVGALVGRRTGASADPLVPGTELVGVLAVVLPAAVCAKGAHVHKDPMGACVAKHRALLHAVRIALGRSVPAEQGSSDGQGATPHAASRPVLRPAPQGTPNALFP
mmetsp:Transcript_64868/g.143239  ORF Transcript_64868/g.143239 Transcript_64868/m.143239 type:complete len:248 (-) Transcript_64868:3-746(-)